MIHFRSLTALLLGAWLGASILADLAVTQNFQAVDRFLDSPGSAAASVQLNAIGRARERFILRRNAAEENNWIFLNWERVEIALGAALFLLLQFGDRAKTSMVAVSLFLLAIVVAEHFLLTPEITRLGRLVDDLPATDPGYGKFWTLHGLYSGLDILKMLIVFGLGARLAIRPMAERQRTAREYAVASLPKQAADARKH